jgi:hypothetical protein
MREAGADGAKRGKSGPDEAGPELRTSMRPSNF